MTIEDARPVVPRWSFIFAPGLKPKMYPKALASGADIVCVELEDGIAPKDKDEARRHTMALFAKPQADDDVERIVRINCLREAFGLADVQAVLATDTPPPALMLPKVRTPDEIVWLDNLLTERGHTTRLHVIIETNEGLEAAFEIAKCSSRIDAMFFGGVDMAHRIYALIRRDQNIAGAVARGLHDVRLDGHCIGCETAGMFIKSLGLYGAYPFGIHIFHHRGPLYQS